MTELLVYLEAVKGEADPKHDAFNTFENQAELRYYKPIK